MNIGLIAHDSKKALMQNFCIAYRGILSKHSLYATGTTGRLIEEVTNLKVHKYLAGPLGGKQQLGADGGGGDGKQLIAHLDRRVGAAPEQCADQNPQKPVSWPAPKCRCLLVCQKKPSSSKLPPL